MQQQNIWRTFNSWFLPYKGFSQCTRHHPENFTSSSLHATILIKGNLRELHREPAILLNGLMKVHLAPQSFHWQSTMLPNVSYPGQKQIYIKYSPRVAISLPKYKGVSFSDQLFCIFLNFNRHREYTGMPMYFNSHLHGAERLLLLLLGGAPLCTVQVPVTGLVSSSIQIHKLDVKHI